MTIAALFILLFFCLLIGLPVAISLGFSRAVTILTFSEDSLGSVSLKFFENLSEHYTLLAIPSHPVTREGETRKLQAIGRAKARSITALARPEHASYSGQEVPAPVNPTRKPSSTITSLRSVAAPGSRNRENNPGEEPSSEECPVGLQHALDRPDHVERIAVPAGNTGAGVGVNSALALGRAE